MKAGAHVIVDPEEDNDHVEGQRSLAAEMDYSDRRKAARQVRENNLKDILSARSRKSVSGFDSIKAKREFLSPSIRSSVRSK